MMQPPKEPAGTLPTLPTPDCSSGSGVPALTRLQRSTAALRQATAERGRSSDRGSDAAPTPALAGQDTDWRFRCVRAEVPTSAWESWGDSSHWDRCVCLVRNSVLTERCVTCLTRNPTAENRAGISPSWTRSPPAQLAPVPASARPAPPSAPARLAPAPAPDQPAPAPPPRSLTLHPPRPAVAHLGESRLIFLSPGRLPREGNIPLGQGQGGLASPVAGPPAAAAQRLQGGAGGTSPHQEVGGGNKSLNSRRTPRGTKRGETPTAVTEPLSQVVQRTTAPPRPMATQAAPAAPPKPHVAPSAASPRFFSRGSSSSSNTAVGDQLISHQ